MGTLHLAAAVRGLEAVAGRFPFPGELPSLVLLVGLATLTLGLTAWGTRGGSLPAPRPLRALQTMEAAIDAATELGRPVHLTTGVEDARSPQTIAAFPFLRTATARAAACGTRLICTSADATVQAVNEEVVREGCVRAGHPEAFNPDDVRYLSDSPFAYAAAVTGIFRRERPAVNVMVGAFNAETMVLIEAGAEAGARQIGATANIYQIPFVAAGCDEALIGEELFAAAAQLTGDPRQRAALVAQDAAKLALLALIGLGSGLSLLGALMR
jgi:hypothetical protein